MPKLTIDGVEIEVAEGTTVLEAAKSIGIEIPHYCYHPGLSIAGNCRMCLVEVEKAPKLMISCDLRAQDGQVIHTRSPKVLEARRAMMEFFLIHHPLDCPICDQAGECHLQEYSVEHGPGESRYTEPKKAMAKAVDIGRHILLDQERCIRCSRCIRFCDEVTGTGELTFFKRGEVSQIGIFPGKRLDNPYSGNVADICPVGALTVKEFRFQARVWFLENTPGICAGCARGCNVTVATHSYDHYQVGRIRRITPRRNDEVNGHWICDEGRMSYQRLDAAPRLKSAESPAGTSLAWDEAVVKAATLLKAAAAEGKAAAVLSPRLTSENLYAWKLLFQRLGDVKTAVRKLIRGEDDDLLIRADKGANSRGAESIFGGETDEAALEESIRNGEVDTLLVAGDPLDPDDTFALADDLKGKAANVLFAGPFVSGAASGAAVLLPCAAWSEEDGTLVNFQGRVQEMKRCASTRAEARPAWRVVCDLAAAAGVEFPEWTSAGQVRDAMKSAVTEFEGN
jgi:NADH-quinone oxidoreductase subunit G